MPPVSGHVSQASLCPLAFLHLSTPRLELPWSGTLFAQQQGVILSTFIPLSVVGGWAVLFSYGGRGL